MKETRATIKDVAALAEVSQATVSLVMNNRPVPLLPDTRLKVLNAAKELDYRPNQLAVSMISRKTKIIGLIIPDADNLFFSDYANKLSYAAGEMGYDLILRNSNWKVHHNIESLNIFEDRSVDGIILAQSEFRDQEEMEMCRRTLRQIRTPTILIDRIPKNDPMESIVLDHVLGGYMAAEHLLKHGHKKIGFISGPFYLTSCVQRLEGYRAALKEGGIEFDESLVTEGELQLYGGTNAVSYLLGRGCTALLAFNDMMSYGIYKYLRNNSLRIPQDISIIGFDDLFFSDIIDPPLTTVEQPLELMARAAIERLHIIIHAETAPPPRHMVFKPVLKVRRSVRSLEKARPSG